MKNIATSAASRGLFEGLAVDGTVNAGEGRRDYPSITIGDCWTPSLSIPNSKT
jgi:hypothetical protein